AVFSRSVAQVIENAAGLHGRLALVRINIEDVAEVLGPVHDNRDVAALTGEAGAAATREHGRAELAAGGDRRNYVINGARDHGADRHLAVVRRIHRVHPAGSGIETHLAL